MRFSEKFKVFFPLVIAAVILTACASMDEPSSPAEPLPLDQSAADKAPVPSDDASVFADINKPEPTPETATATDKPFYSAIGGENLGRVAYALYSNRKMAGDLAKINPEIEAAGTLSAGQQVFFEFTGLRPQPMFLTKDLLERYPEQLAQALDQSTGMDTIKISAGETLQSVSQRLYGTTRYWTEIYLLNRDKLTSFDKIAPGLEISVVRHNALAPVVNTEKVQEQVATNETIPEQIKEAPPTKTETVEDHLTAEVVSPPPKQEVVQPKVETPPPAQIQPKVTEPTIARESAESADGFWTSTNIRRVVYVGLILIITFFAFYMTRPSKKQKFDMLDVTASHGDGPRPKLNRDDHDRNIIG